MEIQRNKLGTVIFGQLDLMFPLETLQLGFRKRLPQFVLVRICACSVQIFIFLLQGLKEFC
ncbi:hypothetical protein QUA81_30635 [Microcoleus sp. F6_B4]|uniref:hypothetical protein n=1 Tax=Microcoleus sp. herbarium5 TaxID=3055434 RepID=UPI002FD6DDD7